MELELVYVTTADSEEAVAIAQVVVLEQLAACANVIGSITSVFVWEGELQQSPEALLLLKTHPDSVATLVDRIRELHSYDCPCVVTYKASGGLPAFGDWVGRQTVRKDPHPHDT